MLAINHDLLTFLSGIGCALFAVLLGVVIAIALGDSNE